MARGRPRRLVGAAAARGAERDTRAGVTPWRAGSPRSSPARPTTSPTSSSTSTTASTATAPARCAPFPRGEVVTYGELAALAGRPGAARAAGTFCARNRLAPFVPCHRVVAAGRDRLVRLARASSTSGGCSRSRMSLSDDLRDELAAIAPGRRCCRLAELSALFHAAGAWHLRGHGELAVHLDLASPAAARRAFALLRDLGVRSEIRTYRRQAFDRATRYQLHVEVDPARRGGAPRGGRALGAAARRSSARRSASSAAPAAAAPTCAAPCSARGSLSGPRAAAPRAARGRTPTVRAAPRRDRRPRGRRARGRASAAATPSRTRRASETIADLLALAGASETALASRRARRRRRHARRGEPAGERRRGQRQADRAARPRQQLEAIRQLDRRRACPAKLQRDRDAPPAASVAVARASSPPKCRPPITKAAAHHRMAVLRAPGRRGANGDLASAGREGKLRGRSPPPCTTLGTVGAGRGLNPAPSSVEPAARVSRTFAGRFQGVDPIVARAGMR